VPSTPALLVFLAMLLLALVATSWNRFVQQRQLVKDSWADVDAELQRRHNLVPSLVATVQGYAAHERDVLLRAIELRDRAQASAPTPAGRAGVEPELAFATTRILALGERYPDLRASAGFLGLQRQLATTEDRLEASRRYYNGNVRDYNRRVESLPSMFVARLGGFRRADYFELDDTERRAQIPSV
jgi:LemA protein